MSRKYIHKLLDIAHGGQHESYPDFKMSDEEAFLETEKEFRRLNALIRNKKINEQHIGNSIFKNLRGEVTEDEIKLYAYDHFTAGYYSFLNIKEKMIKEKYFNDTGIKKYGFLIANILHDIRLFANYIGQQSDPKYILFSVGKSNIEDSRWHYIGTLQLLYNCTFYKHIGLPTMADDEQICKFVQVKTK